MNAPCYLEVQILNQVGGLLQLDVLPPSRQVAREPSHVPRHVHGVWVGIQLCLLFDFILQIIKAASYCKDQLKSMLQVA